ncbi:NUDIX domain-containing protein [Nocardia sp. NPDC058499]|uniref:NUDIX domain-containing protein n=1 Tax=Nocardia sp. NPDC058499 TaxID=3346530 RepID=UPI0036466729
MEPATAAIADLVAAITPIDEVEQQHIEQTLAWLAQTDDIFRRVPPANPPQHLVAYVVLVDPRKRGIYLGRHRKSGLELPMGGHLAPGEHPRIAARREAREELGFDPRFDVVGDQPLFLTMTPTVGLTAGHVDVSFWHVARGDRSRSYGLDPAEFDGGSGGTSTPTACRAPTPTFLGSSASFDSVLQPAPAR